MIMVQGSVQALNFKVHGDDHGNVQGCDHGNDHNNVYGNVSPVQGLQLAPTGSMVEADIRAPDLILRLRLIFEHLPSKRNPTFVNFPDCDNHHFMTSIRIGTALSSLFNHHLRSVGFSIIVTPRHPEPSSHNQSSSAGQCSWEGGKGSPGCCPREEGQHRRKVIGSICQWSTVSSGNNKCLQI